MLNAEPQKGSRPGAATASGSDEIVLELLTPPGLQYIRELSKVLESDPEYLRFHAASVSLRVNEILAKKGPGARSRSLSESSVAGVVREAVVRLRSFEK